jgi:transposase
MINQEKRKVIFLLHEEGMSIKEISRRLEVSRNSVRAIIKEGGRVPEVKRGCKIEIDPELLRKLYTQCNGMVQRVHEILSEEEGLNIGYSTLLRLVHEHGIREPVKKRCEQVPDIPGDEMQHDTSSYKVKIAEKHVKLICSLLYFRYSKVRYARFYRSFGRFQMKCFFHEALMFYGYSAKVCIIDNTNLARLRGSGKNAVIVPEMEGFGQRYGFKFICHAINHPNRKAGNERGFYTIETNFLVGRNFASLKDLNSQAIDWATKRIANRPTGRTGLIPQKVFEHEQSYLVKLAPFVEAPYRQHQRSIDQYGYVMFKSNFYWVPGTSRCNVSVLEYDSDIKIYNRRQLLVSYKLPSDDIKNQSISPPGQPEPKYRPSNRKKPTAQEEKSLRDIGPEVNDYLDFIIKSKAVARHKFIRELFALQRKLATRVFIKSIKRALKYGITDIDTVERISLLLIREGEYETPAVDIDNELGERKQYIDGRFSDNVNLSAYDALGDENDG